MRRSAEVWITSLPATMALGILSLAIYAPLLQAMFGYPFGESGYRLLFSICHQYPLRSFWILDYPMAVCARCTGGYSGIVLGIMTILAKYKSTRHQWLLLSILGCMLVALGVGDAALKVWTGIDGTNSWRFSTGLVGGMGFALLIAFLVSATSEVVEHFTLQLERQ